MEQDGTVSPINLFEYMADIKVIGVGGAGCNAINRMVEAGLEGAELIALNTDRQSLLTSRADHKMVIGEAAMRGLGSGGDQLRGEAAAKESEKEIASLLEKTDMVFVAAGMGGGTGTGAAPVIAQLARSRGILTVGVVTRPFGFEGAKRTRIAREGHARMLQSVDALITIPNDRLLDMVDRRVSYIEAMGIADEALLNGVKGIVDIVATPGHMNVDFRDVQAVMMNSGPACLGVGIGEGEGRGRLAAEAAVKSPLLETPVQGAKKMLVNITHGASFSLHETSDVMDYLKMYTDREDDDIYMGLVLDEEMGEKVKVTVVATHLSSEAKEWDSELFHAADRGRRATPPSDPEETARRRGVPAAQPVLDIAEITDIAIPNFLKSRKGG